MSFELTKSLSSFSGQEQFEINNVLSMNPFMLEFKRLKCGQCYSFFSYHWHKDRTLFESTNFPLRHFCLERTLDLTGLNDEDEEEISVNRGGFLLEVKKTFYRLILPDNTFFGFKFQDEKVCYVMNFTKSTYVKESEFVKIFFSSMDDLTAFVQTYANWAELMRVAESKELEKKILVYTIMQGRWRIMSSVNNNSWLNVFISTKNKETLMNRLTSFVNDEKERAVENGMTYKMNILLYGVPGSGKTTIVKTLSKVLKKRLYLFSFSAEMTDSMFVELFSRVRNNSIVAFEDIDAFFNFRDKTSSNRQVNFSTFLNQLDGVQNATRGIITVLTANYVDRLDPALLRPGRMDLIMHFDYPGEEEIAQAFKFYTKNEHDFPKFYRLIRNLKIPMSGITGYLYRHSTDYFEAIQELLEQYNQVKEIVDDSNKTSIYT
jgi:hypothetical protein